MQVTILEVFKPKRGITRYCVCENSTCEHGNHPCMYNAKVNATVHCPAYGDQTMQLCNDCLANYRKA